MSSAIPMPIFASPSPIGVFRRSGGGLVHPDAVDRHALSADAERARVELVVDHDRAPIAALDDGRMPGAVDVREDVLSGLELEPAAHDRGGWSVLDGRLDAAAVLFCVVELGGRGWCVPRG